MDNSIVKRRRQLPEFRELFKALFKISDHDVQFRVLDAINGIIRDTCDCWCCKKEVADKATQTNFIPINSVPMKRTVSEESPVYIASNGVPEIKKRKRSRKVPRVEKSSSEPEPCLVQNKEIFKTPEKVEESCAFTGIIDLIEGYTATIVEPEEPVTNNQELLHRMKLELVNSEIFKMGLLPLHKAIKEYDLKYLKRQLYVLQFLNKDINELLTEAGETPLQLAIKVDSTEKIVAELLKYNPALDDVDEFGNNIFHLAMMNTANKNILKLLLERLDFDNLMNILMKNNDDGLTVLHVGVKKNNILLTKTLLEYIDEQLNLKTVGNDMLPKDALDFYCRELRDFATKSPIELNKRKQDFINAIDIKHGRTPLFYAISEKEEEKCNKLMIYMLLCHLANPSIRERSGMDCITYVENENMNPQIESALRNTVIYLEKCNMYKNETYVSNYKS